MKKVLALILSIALVLSAVVLPTATFVLAEGEEQTALSFSDAITVLADDLNPRAIRTKVLNDGTVAAVYYRSGSGIYYAESKDGGVSFSEGVRIIANATDSVLAATEVAEGETPSTQVALAKEYVAEYGEYGRGRLEAQNPNLIELKDGNIAAFYRYNTFETDPDSKPWSIYYASICYQIYDREAKTWGDVQVMYSCTEENVVADSGSAYGVWEPDPVYIGDELFCYFADTDLPQNTNYQHIMYCVYDEATGKFGEPAIAQNGIDHESRDGMSVVTKLNDGTYAMVFESTRTQKYELIDDKITFVIKMSFSEDGKSWTDPVIVAKPNPLDEPATASPEYAVCAAPYVITLPDGRLAVSYQTTDRYTGRIPNRVSYRIGTQVAVSSEAITYDTFASNSINDDVTSYFSTELNPGVLGENEFSKSAELMVKDNRLYVYYSIGQNSWTTTDDVETEKHDFGAVKMAHIDLSAPEALDGNSRDNYIVYNSGGKDVTVTDDGAFAFPAGTTNMVYGKDGREVVDNPITIGDLYSESTYTRYAGTYTFDTENDVITTKGQGKALITSTANMTSFNARATIQGNAIAGDVNEGYIWGGFSIFVNPDTISNATFNPEGILIGIRRNTSKLNLVELVVRYCDSTGTQKDAFAKTLSSTFDTTDLDPKFTLDVSSDGSNFTVKVYNAETGAQMGDTYTYSLSRVAALPFTKGALSLMVNGVHTFTDFTVTNATEKKEVDSSIIEKAADLDAHAAITFPEDITASNQVGMSFRVQQGADASPGITGYVLKLLQTVDGDSNITVQLTRYGTTTAGAENKNLGDMYTQIDSTVLGTGSEIGTTILLDASLRGNMLNVTLTNAADATLTSTYEFDLTTKSGSYDTYYAEGGIGFFKNGNTTNITVSDIEFTKVAKNVNNMDTSLYTVYTPDGEKAAYAEGNAFVSDQPSANRIMLNDTLVTDFAANAVFEAGADGNLNAAIVFRAQNMGNPTDAREGYAVSVWKSVATTSNYSRMVILLYKWGIDANGNQKYLGEIARLVDTTTLKSVYPDAENSLLVAAGIHIKLNVEVEGTKVKASFDVLDEYNAVAASSKTAEFDLTAKEFASEADNTYYSAGEVGVSIGTMGKVCDFNLEADGLGINDTDVNDYVVYSNNDDTMVIDDINDKIYSITTGHKQAVLKGRNTNEFDITATLKSTAAGVSYNFGYDFAINESTHSGISGAGSATAYMFEGYRVQLTRTNASGGDLSYANLRLYKFERVDNGDGTYSNKRTELKNVANADFFADYDEVGYGNIEVVLNVKLVDGTLYADAYVKDYPTRTLSYTYTEGMDTAAGTIGWYIDGGGSITMNSIRLDDLSEQLVTAADSENGNVYAVVNSGAVAVHDTVKLIPAPKDGYLVDEVSYTVNGVKTVIPYEEGGYVFEKTYGATEILATFGNYKVGDIDKSGSYNGADLTALRKDILDIEIYDPSYTDCNGDKVIDVRDIVKLKKLAAGIE